MLSLETAQCQFMVIFPKLRPNLQSSCKDESNLILKRKDTTDERTRTSVSKIRPIGNQAPYPRWV